MFTDIHRCCSHAAYQKKIVSLQSSHCGYTVSAAYQKLDELYGDSSFFILFKENYETIEKHLMYGYYNNCYDKHVLMDFKKYWGVNFEQDLQGLELRVNDYYNKVETYFSDKENFILEDISVFGGKWNDFVLSPNFLNFLTKLPYDSEHIIVEGLKEQEKVATGSRSRPFSDFLETEGIQFSKPFPIICNCFLSAGLETFPAHHESNSHIDQLLMELQ